MQICRAEYVIFLRSLRTLRTGGTGETGGTGRSGESGVQRTEDGGTVGCYMLYVRCMMYELDAIQHNGQTKNITKKEISND